MDEKARLSSLCAKIFYYVTHIAYFFLIVFLPNYFWDSIRDSSAAYFTSFIIFLAASIFFYVVSQKDPGFLDQYPDY